MKLKIYNTTRNVPLAISADIAETNEERRRGLLGRVAIAPGEGMLFAPCGSVHTHGMRFPIDILFLGQNNEVLDILPDIGPGGNVERDGAVSVLELPAGLLAMTGTQRGDYLEILPIQASAAGPGCMGLLNLLEEYGVVQRGTSEFVTGLMQHGDRVRAAFQNARVR